ncbi:MAG: glycosyltransferase family 4 protein [Ferrovibrio sp.]|jgi:glycosyltransferase involved in cell wall biosynthesis
MKCLWLTQTDPEPRHNGQLIYSGGLIDAIGQSGAQVDIVGAMRPGTPHRPPERQAGLRWFLAEQKPRALWHTLLSPLPNVADRNWTPQLQRLLEGRLVENGWDVIVFDSLSAGWALAPVLKRYPQRGRRPRLVYVAHNHEESLRQQVAREHPDPLRRHILLRDAAKVARLEQAMVRAADAVTAITPEDRDRFLADHPGRDIAVITPGYGGAYVDQRRISARQPRRAVIVGSFDWIAKRLNLEQFLAAADPLFASHNAELQVIGTARESFLRQVRRRFSAIQFTGPVSGLPALMQDARVALVPERHGGGFKLKVLDYIFNRLPILALEGSVAGMPLRHEDSILLYRDYRALATGVLQVIDDYDRLNHLQDRAYAICRDRFDWASRGRQLLAAIAGP